MLIISSCSLQFEKIALYDEFKKPILDKATKQVVFSDAKGTLWSSLSNCGDFSVTNETAYKGNSSIKLTWTKSTNCEWLGFGNSFNNWIPTNVKQYIHKKAISMFVKTPSNKVNGIPIVLALEDFAGGGSYLFLDSKKYLKGLTIDTTWTQIIVPLWHFPIGDEVENDDVDLSSIKQLKFQLEGSGDFYIDEIELIDFDTLQYQHLLNEVDALKPKGKTPQVIYEEGMLTKRGWGIGEKKCHSLHERSDTLGNQFIEWNYQTTECNWAEWGINWNDWYQINWRGLTEECTIQFNAKLSPDSEFQMIIEDYSGHYSSIPINASNYTSSDDWIFIRIPLKLFKLQEKGVIMDQIKQLKFKGVKTGKICLDDIKLVSI